jgi:hypothetical protein
MENDTNTNENKTAPQTNSEPATDSKSTSPTASGKTNTMAIVALVLTFVFPPIGLIIGIIALNQIKKTHEEGKGLALAAIVLSSLWVALIALAIIMLGIFGVAANRAAKNAGVSVNTKTGTITETKDGNTTQVGESVKLPDGFPSSLPIYPGANLYAASKTNSTDYYVAATTADSFDKVASFYKSQLESNGWTIDSSTDSSDTNGAKGTFIKASTSTLYASVSIQSGSDNKTTITITVNPKE